MTDISNQYRIIASGAGWIDRRARGRLEFEGADAGAFLHAIVSNDVTGLEDGQGVYATFLTPQGRMIADLRIYRRDRRLLADVPPGMGGALAARFDQAIFAEDVRVTDVSAVTAALTIAGAEAAAVASAALELDRQALSSLAVWSHLPAGAGFIARTDDARVPTFDLFFDLIGDEGAWTDTVRRIEAAGAVAVPVDLAEVLRIEAGRPAFGIDMKDDTIPLEAGLLERAISTSKGCYVGQEIVVRILHRGGGRVARRLVTMDVGSSANGIPAAGDVISEAGRDIGRVTSVAASPSGIDTIALGYVHRDAAEVGREVRIGGSGGAMATITGFAG